MTFTANGGGNYTIQLTATEQQSAAVLARRHGAGILKARFEAVLDAGIREVEEELREAWRLADAATRAEVKTLLGLN